MGWADAAIQTLSGGESVSITPHGGSMRTLIESGARVTLDPTSAEVVQVGDAVLCRVSGAVYLHLVKAAEGAGSNRRVLIGNNKGGLNGWTKAVYGRVRLIQNP